MVMYLLGPAVRCSGRGRGRGGAERGSGGAAERQAGQQQQGRQQHLSSLCKQDALNLASRQYRLNETDSILSIKLNHGNAAFGFYAIQISIILPILH